MSRPAQQPLCIGLTGGIGSGKSTVAMTLRQLGATLVDTDAIARRLTGPAGAAMPALRRAFGDAIASTDGALNREAMRALAFSDAAAKQRLEAVLHPLISAEALGAASMADTAAVVFDVPLLAESQHWRERVDCVLVIDCSEATQIDRVVQRPGWSHDAARRAIASQADRATRRAIADAVIFNDGMTLDALEAEVRALWQLWQPATPHPVEQ